MFDGLNHAPQGPHILNKDHWLADRLGYWWPEPDANGVWRDAGPKKRGNLVLESGSGVVGHSRFGSKSMGFGSSAEFTETDVSDIEGATAFTISCWAKAPAYLQDDGAISINQGGTVSKLLILYPYDTVGGNGARLYWNSGSGIINQNSGAVPVNEWHWFCFTSRASNDHEFFVDNNSIGAVSTSRTLEAGTTNFDIGHWNGTQNFTGELFGVTFHRRGFTAEQMRAWYFRERWALSQRRARYYMPTAAAPPAAAIINQIQGANMGADLYNGTLQ